MLLILRKNPYGTGYEIISGHRRKTACKWVGVDEVHAIVMELNDSDAIIAMVGSLYAECEVSYPYYNENKLNPCYAKSFEEILSKIMLNPEEISFTGLEKAYSNQEWNLIHRFQQKLLVKWNE